MKQTKPLTKKKKQKEKPPTHPGKEKHQQHQQQQHKQSVGTYSFQSEEFEDFRPQPAVIIKEPYLKYKGENLKKFLDQFELAAQIYGAGDFGKACQVCRFLKGEDC